MKKLFFFAIVALGMTAACQKPNVEVNGNDPDIDDNTPVAVQFNVNAPTLTVTKTKGNGAIEAWNNTAIYIFSSVIGKVDADNKPVPPFTNPLLDDRKAVVSAIDGTVTFPVEASQDETYYYNVDEVYDFYGYYVDDAKVTPGTDGKNVANDGTNLTATVTIDGSQDVMLATTDKEKDLENVTTTVNSSRIYSAYAARRGVQPTLNFEHMLSRFIFMVKKGTTVNPNTKTVYVSGISVKAPKTGTLTIAPTQSFTATGTDETITAVITDNASITGKTWHKPQDAATQACSDLMLFPEDVTIPLTVELMTDDSDEGDYKMNLDLTPALFKVTSFEQGKQYELTLTVYDLEQISVSAKVAKWTDGGDYEYDPDNIYDQATSVFATKVTNTETNTTTILYSDKVIANTVKVYSDYKKQNIAAAGNYSTTTHSFTVGDDGVVSDYTEITQPDPTPAPGA